MSASGANFDTGSISEDWRNLVQFCRAIKESARRTRVKPVQGRRAFPVKSKDKSGLFELFRELRNIYQSFLIGPGARCVTGEKFVWLDGWGHAGSFVLTVRIDEAILRMIEEFSEQVTPDLRTAATVSSVPYHKTDQGGHRWEQSSVGTIDSRTVQCTEPSLSMKDSARISREPLYTVWPTFEKPNLDYPLYRKPTSTNTTSASKRGRAQECMIMRGMQDSCSETDTAPKEPIAKPQILSRIDEAGATKFSKGPIKGDLKVKVLEKNDLASGLSSNSEMLTGKKTEPEKREMIRLCVPRNVPARETTISQTGTQAPPLPISIRTPIEKGATTEAEETKCPEGSLHSVAPSNLHKHPLQRRSSCFSTPCAVSPGEICSHAPSLRQESSCNKQATFIRTKDPLPEPTVKRGTDFDTDTNVPKSLGYTAISEDIADAFSERVNLKEADSDEAVIDDDWNILEDVNEEVEWIIL